MGTARRALRPQSARAPSDRLFPRSTLLVETRHNFRPERQRSGIQGRSLSGSVPANFRLLEPGAAALNRPRKKVELPLSVAPVPLEQTACGKIRFWFSIPDSPLMPSRFAARWDGFQKTRQRDCRQRHRFAVFRARPDFGFRWGFGLSCSSQNFGGHDNSRSCRESRHCAALPPSIKGLLQPVRMGDIFPNPSRVVIFSVLQQRADGQAAGSHRLVIHDTVQAPALRQGPQGHNFGPVSVCQVHRVKNIEERSAGVGIDGM